MQYKPYYTLEEAVQRVYDFHALLDRHGIKIAENSDLYRLSYNVLEHLEKHQRPELRNPTEDTRPYFREVLGFNDFIAKIYSLELHPDFRVMLPHLKLMNISSIPQTVRSLTDDGSNKLFELYIAALCLHCFENVDLETPRGHSRKSQGKHPDIMFRYRDKSWGMACKVINTEVIKIKTMMDNYAKAVDQIEKSPVDVGVAVISLKNVIDYDELWPILNKDKWQKGEEPEFGSFMNATAPFYMLRNYGNKVLDKINAEYGFDEFKEIYLGKKTVPGFLLFCQTATSLVIDQKANPTILRVLNMVRNPEEPANAELLYLLTRLNHVMQTIN